jgi:hypothetical protein
MNGVIVFIQWLLSKGYINKQTITVALVCERTIPMHRIHITLFFLCFCMFLLFVCFSRTLFIIGLLAVEYARK